MTRFFLITLISFNFLASVNAQYDLEAGYIITNQGDTINGFIRGDKIQSLNQQVSFCRTKKDSLVVFLPKDLKSFWVSPNLYFESHEVISKMSSPYLMPQKLFLFRIYEGYLSVFKTERKSSKAFFIKKQDDDRCVSLYMRVQKIMNDRQRKMPIDTVTEFIISDYRGENYWKRDHIDTLKELFSDWKGYKSYEFDLTEMNIVSQVAAYNKAVHPNLLIENRNKVKSSLAIRVNLLAPLRPQRDIEKKVVDATDKITQSTLNPSFIGGYELSLALIMKGKQVDLSSELGFGHISKARLSYTAIAFLGNNVSKKIEIPAYNYVFLEANTLFRIAKFSPFVGGRIGLILPYNKLGMIDYLIGYQYRINRNNAVKLKLTVQAFPTIAGVYTVVLGVGYQYFL